MLPVDKIKDVALRHLVQDDLLMRVLWNFVREDIFQVVLLKCFCAVMLQTAHDARGHLSIKKTSDVLCYFFWPQLKHNIAKYVKSCHIF